MTEKKIEAAPPYQWEYDAITPDSGDWGKTYEEELADKMATGLLEQPGFKIYEAHIAEIQRIEAEKYQQYIRAFDSARDERLAELHATIADLRQACERALMALQAARSDAQVELITVLARTMEKSND